ncbi:MAG TPA: cyclic nucleotide-binding domain-containing protein [Fibrobacteraceae bacterium]|nr:cyclic nucleotide-binding domain-containing protein [Fibrobacteraceae bacterium]
MEKSLGGWIKAPYEKEKPFLSQIPPEAADYFILKSQISEYDSGAVILERGAEGAFFYVLQSGRAQVCGEVYKGQYTEVASLEKGSCFGEMSLISGETTSNTIIAVEDSTVLHMSKSDFIKFVSDNPGILILLYKVMADRLRAKNQAYSAILHTNLMGHGHALPLIDLAQSFEKSRYTATVFVNNDTEGGALAFKNGQLFYSQVGKMLGADALERILFWGEDVFFRVDDSQLPEKANLTAKASTTSLILDALRNIDEKNLK